MTTVRERISAVLSGAVGWERGLDALTVADSAEIDPVLIDVLGDAFARLWRRGWQPVELHRVVARRGNQTQAHLVADAVAVHLRAFAPTAVDPRWLAQSEALGADVWWTDDRSYLHSVAVRWKLERVSLLDLVLGLLVIVSKLPPIELLLPPPGTAPRRSDRSRAMGTGLGIDVRLLDRVRGLLAQAESTNYPAEAETYTAKAQELVARHSIDEALVVARSSGPAVLPFARRIGVDHPYEGEKAALLDAVARANRCRAVWSPELGFTTIFGFDVDIEAVDLLYTSLLVQAHRAMAKTEPPGGEAGRARLRAYRQSFLVAFAVRIGERLTEAAGAVLAEAGRAADGTGTADAADLVPVLAARDEQVRETMRRSFPHTVRARGTRVDSREGWDSGRDAADRAALHTRAAT